MVQEGVCRGGDVLARIAGIGLGLLLLALAECHDTLGVRHARRGAEEHGNVELLGNAVGLTHEVQAFLRIGRLDHGQLRCAGIVAVILLVLGGVHAGIVCGDNDEAAAVKMGSAATLTPTCFIAQRLRTPARLAP